jgi:signal transduction histidine kinase
MTLSPFADTSGAMQGASPAHPLTVLVVDDNEGNRTLAKEALEDEGYRVVLADGGQAGIDAFERERPDCILLDVRMPGIDGLEVCRRIRATPEGAHTPVVFVTALRDVDVFDEAIVAGGDDFLTKPVRPTELALRVQTALKLRRASTEITELLDLLRHQRDDMLRAILQKEQLTAFLVHDLKNPVAGMAMAAELVAADPEATPRSKEAAGRIRTHAENLQRMIMDLLDLAKGDEGRLVAVRSPVRLGFLLRDLARAFEPRAAARSIRIEFDPDAPTVDADETLLRRVLENLVDNAIRHAPNGTTVRVVVRRGDGIEIRVSDEGPGVPRDMRERIFDRYFRGDAKGQGERGARGLGLAFC